jgi:hypothetical protein
VCDPTPAVPGLKLGDTPTPVPEYVPPSGVPPPKLKAASSTQTASSVKVKATTGKELTVIVIAEEFAEAHVPEVTTALYFVLCVILLYDCEAVVLAISVEELKLSVDDCHFVILPV